MGRLLQTLLTLVLLVALVLTGWGIYAFLNNENQNSPVPQTTEPPIESPEATSPPGPNLKGLESRYIYQQLQVGQQAVYAKIVQAIEAMNNSIIVTSEEEEGLNGLDIFDIFTFVAADYPEFFWMENAIQEQTTTMGQKNVQTEVFFKYIMSEEERSAAQSLVDAYTAACLQDLDPNASDFQKVLHVYDYLIDHTEYVPDAKDNQNILSVFLYGESVCSGYAKSTQYLLHLLEIPCVTVNGDAKGQGSHAWNLVIADGEPYYLDVTWGDPLTSESSSNQDNKTYDYFLVTTAEISLTHTADVKFTLPRCTARQDNYYAATGRMLDRYDQSAISIILQTDAAAGKTKSSFRFTSRAEYQTAVNELFTNQEIFTILRNLDLLNASSTTYTLKDELYIVEIGLL